MLYTRLLSFLLFASMLCLTTPSSAQKMVVTINKFDNETRDISDAAFQTLRSRITDSIINTRKFDVVERQNLDKVLSERKLQEAGLTESDGTEAAGLTAAGYVIYGSVLSFGADGNSTSTGSTTAAKVTAKVELQLRIANAEDGKILSSKTIMSEKSQARMAGSNQSVGGNFAEQALDDAVRDSAKKVTQALMELAFPAKVLKVSGNSLTVNLAQEATEIGAIYEVWDAGEELIDPDTGESLGAAEELVGEVQISRTMPKFSLAKPIGDTDMDFIAPGMILRPMDETIMAQRKAAEKEKKKEAFESRF